MTRSRRTVAAGVTALALILGGGLALASPEDPSIEDGTSDEAVTLEPGAETEGAEELESAGATLDPAEDEGDDGLDGDEVEGEDDGEGEDGDGADNHGALVSTAAQEHAFDEACGNHGAYVSHVARTGEQPACAQEGTEAAEATATEEATPAAKPKAKAASKGGAKAAGKGGRGGGKG